MHEEIRLFLSISCSGMLNLTVAIAPLVNQADLVGQRFDGQAP